MRGGSYIVKRLSFMFVSVYAVATILFLMFRLLPGDPSTAIIAPTMSASTRQQLLADYGLNEPLHVQYISYMTNLAQGNLGISFSYNQSVQSIIVDRLVNTLVLMLPAVTLAYLVGILLGALFAWNRDSKLDIYGTGLVTVLRAAPVFWVGMLGIMVFAFRLEWLPSSGMHSVTFIQSGLSDFVTIDFLRHLILPLVVTATYFLMVPTLTMRSNMIDVLDEDYIELAQAEGLSEFRILYRHAARNALLPVLHYAAVSFGFAFGGSVIIETVFSWPGIGNLMWEAVRSQDYPLAQGSFLILASVVISMNFLADLISVYVDPRVSEYE